MVYVFYNEMVCDHATLLYRHYRCGFTNVFNVIVNCYL